MADLSILDDLSLSSLIDSEPKVSDAGKALEIDINKIHVDDSQPRKKMDVAKLKELANSMLAVGKNGKKRGVKSPISVKSHPTIDGDFIINHGHRRYEAAKIAKLETIPCFIDSDHDDYDKVIENIQREDLKVIEIAHFIQKRLNEGEKQVDIAKQLGKDKSYVSLHAQFFEFPDCVRELYDNDYCQSIKALHLLHKAHSKFTEEVERFCDTDKEVTRAEVINFVDTLKKKVDAPKEAEQHSTAEASQPEQGTSQEQKQVLEKPETEISSNEAISMVADTAPSIPIKAPEPVESSQLRSIFSTATDHDDVILLAEPVLTVRYEGQLYTMLTTKVAVDGKVFLLADNEEEVAASINDLELVSLKEG